MFDFASMLGGLGGANANPGTLMSVLGMGNVADPAMTQAATGMAAPGTMPAGMGNPGLSFPGTQSMPGQGVQMPGAGGNAPQTPMASMLASAANNPQLMQAMMQAGPMMAGMGQQQQQPQQAAPGALPIAGAMGGTALRRSPNQGYMAQGGGIAPQRVLRV